MANVLFIVFSGLLLSLTTGVSTYTQGRQEGGMIKYYNQKYVSEAFAITRRVKRGGAYTTNATATLIHPWTNNVTVQISVKTKYNKHLVVLKNKLCQYFKITWSLEYVKQYTDIPPVCPVPLGRYGFYNLEWPPKNFPLPVPQDDFELRMLFSITDTEEHLIDFVLKINV